MCVGSAYRKSDCIAKYWTLHRTIPYVSTTYCTRGYGVPVQDVAWDDRLSSRKLLGAHRHSMIGCVSTGHGIGCYASTASSSRRAPGALSGSKLQHSHSRPALLVGESRSYIASLRADDYHALGSVPGHRIGR
eukprot:2718407-Rhodomonas_salina.2